MHAQYDRKHEWRAAWMATVYNIDWPTSSSLTTAQQKAELISYLNLFKSLNFNAIIFQARPAADALYASRLEPWSLYLTGKQGRAPDPFWDPLAFIVEEAHKRGMELHAWLNPYRLTADVRNLKDVSPDHIYNTHPEWFTQHENRSYFDPALPQTRDFLCNVVADIVRRYDVDGVHLDDYFYPNNDFIDDSSFALHNRGYTPQEKMAWRRENVDLVIQQLRDTIKSIKPYVKFGISPYAVWRNKRDDPRGSDTRSFSYTNYDNLHADVLKWMENKWIDYILPQLYFHIGNERVDFAVLARWWADYCNGLPLYAGFAAYKLDAQSADEAWRTSQEVVRQIEYIRGQPEYSGGCFYSAKHLRDNILGIKDAVMALYSHPALAPPFFGFSTRILDAPQQATMTQAGDKMELRWRAPDLSDSTGLPPFYYAVYRFSKGEEPDFSKGEALVWVGGETHCTLPADPADTCCYYVSALDRLFNEGKITTFAHSK